MKNFIFRYQDIPKGWTLCFNDNCTRKDECLRRQAAMLAADVAPEQNMRALCVTPTAYRDGECRLFAAVRTELMAWGFSHLYDQVLRNDYAELKDAIIQYLHGQTNYYRYRNGTKKLSEAQQQWIANLFRRFGYEKAIRFDHYEYHTVFPF